MATETMQFGPVAVELVTEDESSGTRVDEFGETVNVYRLKGVNFNNPGDNKWNFVIYHNGEPVYVKQITAGLETITTIQEDSRFDMAEYSMSISRVND